MATIQKKISRGRPYWYIVESRRVHGQPRPIVLKYLGTAAGLLERLSRDEAPPAALLSYTHGGVMALYQAARALGLAELIDAHVGPGRRGVSVGEALVWIALQRALAPGSKRGFAAWARGTSLGRIVGVALPRHSAGFFWDQMDAVPPAALPAIQAEMARRCRPAAPSGDGLNVLYYDTTNWHTYLDTTNLRSQLARRGRNKQHRHDLRQVGLMLLIGEEAGVPLGWSVYEGHRNDVDVFAQELPKLLGRLRALGLKPAACTLVYDGGCLSRPNQAALERRRLGYVARFPLRCVPAQAGVADAEFQPLAGGPYRVWRTRLNLWGKERTVVVIRSERLYRKQWLNILQALGQALPRLRALQQALADSRRPRRLAVQRATVRRILARTYLRRLVRVTLTEPSPGRCRLDFELDDPALRRLQERELGRRVIVTNRHAWDTRRIVAAYHGQARVEAAFRLLKDDALIALRPQYHWTDQKIQVHTLTCVMAYVLILQVHAQAVGAGFAGSPRALLQALDRIRLVCRTTRPTPKSKIKLTWQLEAIEPAFEPIYRALVPQSVEPL